MDLLIKIVKANPTDYTGDIYAKVKQCITEVLQLEPVCCSVFFSHTLDT